MGHRHTLVYEHVHHPAFTFSLLVTANEFHMLWQDRFSVSVWVPERTLQHYPRQHGQLLLDHKQIAPGSRHLPNEDYHAKELTD